MTSENTETSAAVMHFSCFKYTLVPVYDKQDVSRDSDNFHILYKYLFIIVNMSE